MGDRKCNRFREELTEKNLISFTNRNAKFQGFKPQNSDNLARMSA
jgi:hypothetical protein